MAGGRGSLANALLLVAWFQVILLVVVLALTALGLILPPAAGLLALALPVLVGWMLTQFVMELHGFTSAWRVLFGILGGYVAVVIALSLVLAAVGFGG